VPGVIFRTLVVILAGVMQRLFVLTFVVIIGVALAAQSRQTSTVSGDWPMYSLNLAGTRYSPLTDINTTNVATLTQAWSVRLTQAARVHQRDAVPAQRVLRLRKDVARFPPKRPSPQAAILRSHPS
jgi:glucose dehydrogenase